MTPVRIQRKRTKGWKMPPNTLYVGRGSKWGNPYYVKRLGEKFHIMKQVGDNAPIAISWYTTRMTAITSAIMFYRDYIEYKLLRNELDITELRGKHLACWCPLNQPCNADVLLELANKEEA